MQVNRASCMESSLNTFQALLSVLSSGGVEGLFPQTYSYIQGSGNSSTCSSLAQCILLRTVTRYFQT